MAGENRGIIDETEKQFSPDERAIADYLAVRGSHIKALAETGVGRQADALVDGAATEFKSLYPDADSNTIRQTVNDSLRRGGQARNMIIDARQSKLTPTEAETSLRRIRGILETGIQQKRQGQLDRLRIIGNGFDVVGDYVQTPNGFEVTISQS